jgi:PKD repeat protein
MVNGKVSDHNLHAPSPMSDVIRPSDRIYHPGTSPVANFIVNTISGSVLLTVQITDTSTSFPDWWWTFGDGSNSKHQNQDYTYTGSGQDTVVWTVRNEMGMHEERNLISILFL